MLSHRTAPILVVVSLLIIGCAGASTSPSSPSDTASTAPSAAPQMASTSPSATASTPPPVAQPAQPSQPPGVPAAACGVPPGHALIDNPPHWPESKECREGRIVWSNIPTADLTCQRDSDCALFNDHCFVQALNRRASQNPRYTVRTCGSPVSGQCPQRDYDARCVSGCCTAADKF